MAAYVVLGQVMHWLVAVAGVAIITLELSTRVGTADD